MNEFMYLCPQKTIQGKQMIKYKLPGLILFCAVMMWPLTNHAQKAVYAFGFGTSFNDSTVYLSAIQVLPEAQIQKKTGFLEHRASYTSQMKRYLENNYVGHETCVLFFSTKKEKLEKKYIKVRRQAQRNKQQTVKELSSEEFSFSALPKAEGN